MTKLPAVTYRNAGVNTQREDVALERMISRFQETCLRGRKLGAVMLDIGFFANVIDLGLGGVGLALSADGVGTKVLIAQMMRKYDSIGIDCVAMNVNDILCVGARPISMVDYIAVQDPHPSLLEDISKGLCEGAKIANISIPGGEIAQLREIVVGYKEGFAFDLAGMAVGTVALDKIIIGRDIQPGDAIIGVESNGIHSNGLTMARRIFFEEHHCTVDTKFPALEHSLGEELLKPTYIYSREVLDILDQGIAVKALVHITSNGFLNLTRVASDVSYVIEKLPPPPPIFDLIQKHGNVSHEEMFSVYNMGVGFCIVVSPDEADRIISIAHAHERRAQKLGYTTPDKERRVFIKPKGLVGKGKRFFRE